MLVAQIYALIFSSLIKVTYWHELLTMVVIRVLRAMFRTSTTRVYNLSQHTISIVHFHWCLVIACKLQASPMRQVILRHTPVTQVRVKVCAA